MIGSNSAQLSAIESTPVSGVEMRKETVAPRVAPCRASPSAVGSTPHEQRGRGVPIADAQSTDLIRPARKSRISVPAGTRTARTPARTNPSRR